MQFGSLLRTAAFRARPAQTFICTRSYAAYNSYDVKLSVLFSSTQISYTNSRPAQQCFMRMWRIFSNTHVYNRLCFPPNIPHAHGSRRGFVSRHFSSNRVVVVYAKGVCVRVSVCSCVLCAHKIACGSRTKHQHYRAPHTHTRPTTQIIHTLIYSLALHAFKSNRHQT